MPKAKTTKKIEELESEVEETMVDEVEVDEPKVESKKSQTAEAVIKALRPNGRFQLVELDGKAVDANDRRYTVVNKSMQRVCPVVTGPKGFTECNKLVSKFNMKDPEQKMANKKKGTGNWENNLESGPAVL